MSTHDHEDWQVREGDGYHYCAACGERVRRHASGSWVTAERRLVVMLNGNVTMSRGKAAAQAVHAALLLLGTHPDTPVLVLTGSPGDLARQGEVEVRDAGRTEVEPGTLTAVAFWHDGERVQ